MTGNVDGTELRKNVQFLRGSGSVARSNEGVGRASRDVLTVLKSREGLEISSREWPSREKLSLGARGN